MSITGGCQCGAIRFRAEALGDASVCHCRMCQKATGGLFGPYVELKGLEWTRGERSRFQSSNKVWRGFCPSCGTPLTFEHVGGGLSVMVGALDQPATVQMTEQLGSPSKIPWVDNLSSLPVRAPTEPKAAAYLAGIVNLQHPDHET